MYYVFLPLPLIYYFYVWNYLTGHRPAWRRFAAICLAATLWFQGGVILKQLTTGRSVYFDRAKLVEAIQQKNYHILWERREGSYY